MDDFVLLKLNRAIWLALLENKKIVEAAGCFDNFISTLVPFTKEKKYSKEAFDEIITTKQIFIDKLDELGTKYVKDCNWANALLCYTIIFKYERSEFKYVKEYLNCLKEMKQFDLQAEIIKYMEDVFSDNPETYSILAGAYGAKGDYDSAVKNYEKFLSLKEGNCITAGEYNNMGHYYFERYRKNLSCTDQAELALKNFMLAAENSPDTKIYNKNVTVAAAALNKFDIYMKYYDRLIEMDCINDNDKFDYAAFSLKSQNFENWHKYYDYRFTMTKNRTEYPDLNKPKWNGKTDLSKKTLLIHCEQGFGDMFLAWGYVQRIAHLAKRTIFVAQDEITSLLQNNKLGVEVISKKEFRQNGANYDYHLPAMSIMTTLKLTRENLSTGGSYIEPPADLVNFFKEKYFNKPTKKLRIGLSFQGNTSTTQMKNLPVKYLKPLDQLENVELYLLQKDADINLFSDFKHNKVIKLSKDFKDFAHTAAAMSNLDLILTVDNCIMNLAGAMGLKTFALFNWTSEYRWFDLSGEDIIYYPTVKPFVNDSQHHWEHSINLAIEAIKHFNKK